MGKIRNLTYVPGRPENVERMLLHSTRVYYTEAELRYVDHLCRRAKIKFSLLQKIIFALLRSCLMYL